jgi:hypothetical protein
MTRSALFRVASMPRRFDRAYRRTADRLVQSFKLEAIALSVLAAGPRTTGSDQWLTGDTGQPNENKRHQTPGGYLDQDQALFRWRGLFFSIDLKLERDLKLESPISGRMRSWRLVCERTRKEGVEDDQVKVDDRGGCLRRPDDGGLCAGSQRRGDFIQKVRDLS